MQPALLSQNLATPLAQILADGSASYVYGTDRLLARSATARTISFLGLSKIYSLINPNQILSFDS